MEAKERGRFTEMGGNWEMGGRMKGERMSAYLGGRVGVVETFQLSAYYIWSKRGGAEHLSLTYRAHSQHTTSKLQSLTTANTFPIFVLVTLSEEKKKDRRRKVIWV